MASRYAFPSIMAMELPARTCSFWPAAWTNFWPSCKGRVHKYLRPDIKDTEWGRMLTLIDPFKNEITFCERDSDAS